MKRLFILLVLGTVLFSIYSVLKHTPISPIHAAQSPLPCDEDALRAGLSTGGTLQLAANCTYQLTRNLPHIQADIVIEGNGAAIDGQSTYRMLSSIMPITITLRNLTLKNGAYGEGGALYVRQGTVTISDSTFENNQALFGSGGAIWVKQGSITIRQSSFLGNTAYDRGGAVWIEDGPLDITSSTFSGNQASVGGGLYAHNGIATVTGSTFTENAAFVDAYRARGDDETGGGAIFAENQDVIITNSSFSDNVAITGSGQGVITMGRGGGVNARTGDIVLSSSTFTRNQAYIGGALYAHAGVIRAAQSIIADNQAEYQGADISFDNRFESLGYNLVGDDESGRLTIATTDYVNVSADLAEISAGLFALSSDSPARDAVPPDHRAELFDLQNTTRPQGSGCDIGALEMPPSSLVQPTTTILPTAAPLTENALSCTEDQLRAALAVGDEFTLPAECVIVLTGDLPDITHSITLHGNGSVIDGAEEFRLLYSSGPANIAVDDIVLQNGRGSAIFAARGAVTVTNSILADNTTDHIGGGGVYAGSGSITINNSQLVRNTAPHGGGVYAYNGNIEWIDSTSEANSATGSGGGLWAARGNVMLTNGTFINNEAQAGHGGGLYVKSGSVSITDSTFQTNRALRGSGWLYSGGAVSTGSGDLTITNSQFTENSGGAGGAVAAEASEVIITDSTFTGNLSNNHQVHEGGGGLWVGAGNTTLTNTIFVGNSTQAGGGGAYFVEGDLSVNACAFLDNVAADAGGLGVFQGFATIVNSTFAGNQAGSENTSSYGGAFSSWGGATFTQTTIVNNSAHTGGGINASQGYYELEQTIVASNTAEEGPDLDIHSWCTFVSKGYNLIGIPAKSNVFTPDTTDIVTADIGLLERGDTFFLLTTASPALDAIPSDQCATSEDQRGVSRPQAQGCDIGAVEMIPD